MKYLILGAGPAGLTLANKLLQNKENDLLVLERNSEAGGLCRSQDVDGSPLDIGGGHFLDVRNPKVLDFLFPFMPEDEWDRYERDSRIVVNGYEIGSPIEANIWQMPIKDQVEYLKAVAAAGCNRGEPMPVKFTDWIYWKLGERVAEDYMIPYNQKMFGEDLDLLGTYWLNKLPNVSFEETLISCLEKKAYGTQPGHAQFYYPKKYGYGEIWNRMAAALGDKLHLNEPVTEIDWDTKTVNGIYKADVIISTIPLKSVKTLKNMPKEMMDAVESLKYTSVVIEYVPDNLDTKAQWVYYPNQELSYHRILVRHNFCPTSVGYWTETNLTRFEEEGKNPNTYYINDYAYPLNTIGKNETMQKLLDYMKSKGFIGLGRWGEWQHYNSDVVVAKALELAESL